MDTTHLSTKDAAKAIRVALRDAFPDGRFSVRIDSFSGGSSIDVRYTDGPAKEKVDAIVGAFGGRGFDGSIDLGYSISYYVDAAGKIIGSKTEGTAGSGGYVPAHDDAPADAVRLVSVSGAWINVTRSFSPDASARRDAFIRSRYGVDHAYMAPPGAYRTADEALGDLAFAR